MPTLGPAHVLQHHAVALQGRPLVGARRLVTEIDTMGLSLDTIRHQIASGGVEFDIEQAAGTGGVLPLARLTLRHLVPAATMSRSTPPCTATRKSSWLRAGSATFAVRAYRRSREGRDAQ
jgi:hypothetical protein